MYLENELVKLSLGKYSDLSLLAVKLFWKGFAVGKKTADVIADDEVVNRAIKEAVEDCLKSMRNEEEEGNIVMGSNK